MSHHEDAVTGESGTPPAATPPPAPPDAAPAQPAAPAPPPPAAGASPAPAAAPAGPDIGDAVGSAMASLNKRYTTPELLMGGGALLVLAVWVLFGVLLGSYWPNDVTFATSALLVLVIAGRAMGIVDFGPYQRSVVIALGFLMGAILVNYVLYYFRGTRFSGQDTTYLLGLFLTWVGQAAAAAGAFLTWRSGSKA